MLTGELKIWLLRWAGELPVDQEEQGPECPLEKIDRPRADLARVAAIERETDCPAGGGAQGCDLSQRKTHGRANRLTPVSRECATRVG